MLNHARAEFKSWQQYSPDSNRTRAERRWNRAPNACFPDAYLSASGRAPTARSRKTAHDTYAEARLSATGRLRAIELRES